MGTTRRREAVDKNNLYLDMAEDVAGWQCPEGVAVAVVCAGVTKLDACKRDPIATARVNVHGISQLVRNLVERGVFIIYLSTNQVFDGTVPYRMPDDVASPVTEYGRQKAEAERRVSRWGDSIAIARFTKILGSEVSLFSEWVESLKRGEAIHPFSDMVMAPIPLWFAVSVLRFVGERRLSGIMQVSGGYDVSYTEAAYRGAKLLNIDSELVQPIETCKASRYIESPPQHTTLNVDRLRSVLGIGPPDVWRTIEKMFVQPQVLDGLIESEEYVT